MKSSDMIANVFSTLMVPLLLVSAAEQHTIIDQDRDPQEETLPLLTGVGMDLTSSYGTVAVAFMNGSIFNVARVDGDQSYQDTMRNLSLDSSWHPSPPYNNWDEMMQDEPRQKQRRERKARGLPASDDVAVLAEMLSSLRDAAEDYLHASVDTALAATPNLVALNREDVEDAFEFISLESLDRDYNLLALFRERAAVEASHGVGLCSKPEDPDACLEEVKEMPLAYVLTVLYTKDALCIEVSTTASVSIYFAYPTKPTSMDFSLGLDAKHDNPSEKYYWEAVKDRIKAGLLAGSPGGKIEKLFLFGESSEDWLIRFWLEDTLANVLGYVPDAYLAEPVFSAARGSAEIARRGGYGAH